MFDNEKTKEEINNQHELSKLKVISNTEIQKIISKTSGKEIAQRYAGKYGLLYITITIGMFIGAGLFMEKEAFSKLLGLGGVVLSAEILLASNLVNGRKEKEEDPIAVALMESLKAQEKTSKDILASQERVNADVQASQDRLNAVFIKMIDSKEILKDDSPPIDLNITDDEVSVTQGDNKIVSKRNVNKS